MKNDLQLLDGLLLNFDSGGLFFLNLILAVVMFGVALEIKPKKIKEVFLKPKGAIAGIISQFLILPLITFLLTIIFSNYLTVNVALGMIMVASCPGGNISNFISNLAKGNTALSISLTGLSSIGAIFLTPANFSFYGTLFIQYSEKTSDLIRPISIDPIQMFYTVFIILGIPLIIGIQFSKYFPKITKRLIFPMKIFSIIAFIGFVVIAFWSNLEHFVNHIKWVVIIVFIHNSVAILAGYTLAKILKMNYLDSKTIAIETGIQNSGLALVLIFNPKLFPINIEVGAMAYIAAWWGIWHIISGLGIAAYWRRKP